MLMKTMPNRTTMKTTFALLFALLCLMNVQSFAQGVGISESSITPDASAILELRSTTRGFLFPRNTSLSTTAAGLSFYNSSTSRLNLYNGSGWLELPVKTDHLGVFGPTTSAQLLGVLSDETGTGSLVFSISPSFTTPNIGTATATSLNKLSITAPATGSTLTIADGKTLTASNTLSFTGTDGSTLNIGAGGTLGSNAFSSSAFAPLTSPTFTGTVTVPTPFTLGATSVTTTGAELNFVSGVTSSIQTQINTKQGTLTNSAGLAGALSDETGTGATVFATSPTLTTPNIGAATATTVNKVTVTAPATGSTLTITDGKTLTSSNTLTLAGTDGSTLNIGAGGTLGSNAFSSSAFAPLASPTFTGTVTVPTPFTLGATSVTATGSELNFVAGVTSAIQTQINAKQSTLTNSAGLAGALSDETGSGAAVFATSPTLVTPVLGVASATTINKIALTAPATGSTLTIADGKTLTSSNTLTLAGTDGSTLNIGAGGTLGSNAFSSSAFATLASPTFTGTVTVPTPFTLGATSVTATGAELNFVSGVTSAIQTQINAKQGTLTNSAGLAGALSDETGTGLSVFATSPVLTTPNIGVATATSVNKVTVTAPATSATLTLANGSTLVTSGAFSTTLTSSAATNVTLPTSGTLYGTAASSITSANLSGSLSDETGSGAAVFATSPTLTTPALGVATATSVNGLSLTANAIGFAVAGGTTSKTLTMSNTLTLAGTDGSTLNIGAGGTLGSNAFSSSAFATLASPTFTGTVTVPTPFTLGATSVTATGAELNFVSGVTSAIQTQINAKQSTLTNSAGLAGALSDETGSGSAVFATSPTLVTPALGAATATSVNGLGFTANATGFSVAGGTVSKTLTLSNTLTFSGTDGSTLNVGAGGTLGANAFLSTSFAPLASPTFTGTVTVPTPFTLGATSVTATGAELNFVSGVTSAIQTQINAKQSTLTNSAGLAGALSDETGTGAAVFANTPTLVTPVLGVASATSVNKVAVTAPATAATLTLADGSTLATSGAFSTTLTASGATNVTLPTTGTLYGTAAASITSANLLSSISDETGTGAAVFATSPTLVTPVLGVASATSVNKVAVTAPAASATLTLADGSTLATSGAFSTTLTASAATNVTLPTTGTLYGTAANSISSANLLSSISDETGTGIAVFSTSPTLVTPVLGVASATTVNKVAITAPATGSTLTVADGKTLTASNTLTFTGTDGSSVAFGAGGTAAYTANNLSAFAATTSAQLAGVLSDETGTGAVVLAANPSLTGFTSTGAITNINASSNFATNINTGTSTGAVNIGNTSNSTGVNISTGPAVDALTTLGTTGSQVFASSTTNSDKIAIQPQTTTATATFEGTITSDDLTATRTWTFPDADGRIALARNNCSTADQTINAATTALLTGSTIAIPSTNLRIGTVFKFRVTLSKTAAGTAANTFTFRIGTLGTTGDPAICTFAMPVGTAVIDVGQIDVTITIRGPISAACIAQGHLSLNHNLATTGLSTIGVNVNSTSAAFNATTANLIASLSCTTAAATVLTFQQVIVEAINL